MLVGRFAKLAFLIPAVLLAVGVYSVASWSGCGPSIPTSHCVSNATNECPPMPAAETACEPPVLGWAMLILGVISTPLAYAFYRSRFYVPIPP